MCGARNIEKKPTSFFGKLYHFLFMITSIITANVIVQISFNFNGHLLEAGGFFFFFSNFRIRFLKKLDQIIQNSVVSGKVALRDSWYSIRSVPHINSSSILVIFLFVYEWLDLHAIKDSQVIKIPPKSPRWCSG